MLLKHGMYVNQLNWSNATPLHKACQNEDDNVEVVEFLLSKGADIHAVNDYGSTPIHYACIINLNVVKSLIKKGSHESH